MRPQRIDFLAARHRFWSALNGSTFNTRRRRLQGGGRCQLRLWLAHRLRPGGYWNQRLDVRRTPEPSLMLGSMLRGAHRRTRPGSRLPSRGRMRAGVKYGRQAIHQGARACDIASDRDADHRRNQQRCGPPAHATDPRTAHATNNDSCSAQHGVPGGCKARDRRGTALAVKCGDNSPAAGLKRDDSSSNHHPLYIFGGA